VAGRLRIKGVVAFADRVRRELSAPISEARKTELERERTEVVRQVDGILARHQTHIDRLPEPTRRAYRFLSRLNVQSTTTVPASSGAAPPRRRGGVTLPGMKAYWDDLIADMATAESDTKRDEILASLERARDHIERNLKKCGYTVADLTEQFAKIRGWFTFFAQREAFDTYTAALDRARPAFVAALQQAHQFEPPALIEFRPMRGVYRVRGYADGTRVVLPTPMIIFTPELFQQLAAGALLGGDRQGVMEATASEAYVELQTELDVLCGAESAPAGVCRDLGESFDRVNAKYFEKALPMPRLVWSRTFTGRKFGHYEFIGDTIMVSCTLDRTDVPEFVLDFVMYHEMLHKRLGLEWRNGRGTAHTPEFRRQERLFDRYEDADAFLSRLAGGMLP